MWGFKSSSSGESEEEGDGRFGLGFLFGGNYNADDDIFVGKSDEIFTEQGTLDKMEQRSPTQDLSIYAEIIHDIQTKTPEKLLSEGWTDTTPEGMRATKSREFSEPKTGLRIRFDEGKSGEPGYGGKDHYHVYNPYNKRQYLDINAKPTDRGSKASHILIRKEGESK